MPFSRQRLQEHMALFGYVSIDTPLIEPASLFLTKAGDQIIEHLFSFEHHGQHYALRPEFTASAASRYVRQRLDGVVRWQFNGAVFEDMPELIGQHGEYTSLGAELIGLSGTAADAEMMSMAALGLMTQGLSHLKLVVGHVGLTRHLLQNFQLDDRTLRFLLNQRVYLKDAAYGKDFVFERLDRYLSARNPSAVLDALETFEGLESGDLVELMTGAIPEYVDQNRVLGVRTREDIARRLITRRQRAIHRDQIIAALSFLVEWSAIEDNPATAFKAIRRYTDNDPAATHILETWVSTLNLLDAYDIPPDQIVIQPDLARSWDYYTGIVFELRAENGIVLAGGGRYDELTRLIGGEHNIPAVGFACYADALALVMGVEADYGVSPITITGNDTAAVRWAQVLRQQGLSVITSYDASNDNSIARAVDTETLEIASQHYAMTETDIQQIIRVLKKVEIIHS